MKIALAATVASAVLLASPFAQAEPTKKPNQKICSIEGVYRDVGSHTDHMMVPRSFTADNCTEWAKTTDTGKAVLYCFLPGAPKGERFVKATDKDGAILKNACYW
jgi:hypothetical protein